MPEPDLETEVRLQKLLAQAGVASRRACEGLMLAGRVTVDGEVVTRLGTKVDPTRAVIRVDGARLPPLSRNVYLVLNKPMGVVSTMSDPQGRPCLGDLVAGRPERLFHVGRLDADTEGLLLLTNDGELAHRLAHPSHEVAKTYVAQVEGRVRASTRRRLLEGVPLDDGRIVCDAVTVRDTVQMRGEPRTLVEVVVHEGRNRVVRRMFEAVGHPVRRLTRTALGGVRVGTLRTGQLRELTAGELGRLLDLVGL